MTNIIYPSCTPTSFDYLGEVPKHWATMVLRRLTTNHKQGYYTSSGYVDSGVKLLRITDIGENGTISYADCPNVSSADPTLKNFLLKNGDFVFARTGGAGSFGLVQDLSEDVVFASYLIRFQFNAQRATSGFLKYYLLSYSFFRAIGQNVHGGVNQNIHAEDIKNAAIAIPPLEEQTQIAKFLDYETAKIDALIAKQQQLIALLQEKRQAVISHAVTKGLNPDAPLRDSGVEWLGKVPAHWEVSQLKYLAKPGTSITYGIVQAGPHIEDGVPYIKTSDMSGAELPISGYSKTSKAIDESYSRSRVFPGDIVISIRASVGKCLPVPNALTMANLTQGTAKISPGARVQRDFLLAYMSATPIQNYLMSMAKGATFKEITLDMLRRVPTLVPPMEEQTAISKTVGAAREKYDRLAWVAETQANLLQERRTALISAAVTGKIDVRGWQPPLANPAGAMP